MRDGFSFQQRSCVKYSAATWDTERICTLCALVGGEIFSNAPFSGFAHGQKIRLVGRAYIEAYVVRMLPPLKW